MDTKGTENISNDASLNTSANGPSGKVRKSRANRMANAPSANNNKAKEGLKIAAEPMVNEKMNQN